MATGVVAQDDVTKDLLTAKDLGREALEEYVKHCLQDQDVSMVKPITRLKLKTFVTMENSSAKEKKLTKSNPQSDRELFGRLLVISKDRNVDLKELFSFELTSIPQSSVNSDGSLSKTNKAQTLRDLESHVQATNRDHLMELMNKSDTGVFVDHMACVKKLSSWAGINTFGDLYAGLTNFVQEAFKEGDIVHIVSDKYDAPLSIKSGERIRRGNIAGSPEIVVHSEKQVLPRNMKTYLANPKTKAISIISFSQNGKKGCLKRLGSHSY